MSLMARMLKQSKGNANASVLSKSKFFGEKEQTPTSASALNIILSGCYTGGFAAGLTQIAGPSKHFKSNMGLALAAAYLKRYEDSVMLFFDSEFGATPKYFESFGIDNERVIHEPIKNIEELKFRIMKYLDAEKEKDKENCIKKGDKVFIFIDSVGNLASKKEVEDAIKENAAADMTRAKQLKSLWRILTPYLTMLDLPCVAINHTYQTQEMYSKTVVSGGTGNMYSSDTIITVGRQQEKDGKELTGYNFILCAEKSRFVREQSKIPLEVRFDGGINPFSGLLEIALHTGHVIKPKVGWFSRSRIEGDKSWRRAETNCEEFWKPVLEDESFMEAVHKMYRLGETKMIDGEPAEEMDIDPDTGEVLE